MFTGLVEVMGLVVERIPAAPGVQLIVDAPTIAADAALGESICVNGCCLTVVLVDGRGLHFDVGEESLQRTNLGAVCLQSRVNLERSLRAGDRLGGHFVTGHIDGLGYLDRREDTGDWSKFWIRSPEHLLRQMASKGSIAVDGVSLTLVDVDHQQFSVALIPHTLQMTTLGSLALGDAVNLETDILAKYVERQLRGEGRGARDEGRDRGPGARD